jgi:DNA topoisomerase VI subunit B
MHGKQQVNVEKNKYKTIMRYVSQLSKDLGSLTGTDKAVIRGKLEELVTEHYPKVKEEEETKDEDESTLEIVESSSEEEKGENE